MPTTRKLRTKKHAHDVYIDEEDILCVVYQGDFNEKDGMKIYKTLIALAADLQVLHKPVRVLADTRDMGVHTPGSRRSGFLIRENVPFEKMAIIITPEAKATRKISEILTSAFRRKQIRYFKSDKWARHWLLR